MFRLTVLAALLSGVLAVSIGTQRWVGAAQPSGVAPTFLIAAEIEQSDGVWCWSGICPGQTSLGDAYAQVARQPRRYDLNFSTWRIEIGDGLSVVFNTSFRDPGVVSSIVVLLDRPGSALRFGDAILFFGRPSLVSPIQDFLYNGKWANNVFIRPGLYVKANRRDKFAPVYMLELDAARIMRDGRWLLWHGFTARVR